MPFYWILHTNKIHYLLGYSSELLDESEKKSLHAISNEQLKLEKLLGRCAIKFLLSTFLNKHPLEIKINFPKMGKPKVQKEQIHFNYSHSNGYFAFAVDWDYEVGIDIELINHIEYADKIVDHYFSDKEKKDYYNYSTNKKISYFLLIWTRIEAYTKCLGYSLFDYQTHNVDSNLKQYSSAIGNIIFSICSADPKAIFIEGDRVI